MLQVFRFQHLRSAPVYKLNPLADAISQYVLIIFVPSWLSCVQHVHPLTTNTASSCRRKSKLNSVIYCTVYKRHDLQFQIVLLTLS